MSPNHATGAGRSPVEPMLQPPPELFASAMAPGVAGSAGSAAVPPLLVELVVEVGEPPPLPPEGIITSPRPPGMLSGNAGSCRS